MLQPIPFRGYPVRPISHNELRRYGRGVQVCLNSSGTERLAVRKIHSIDDKLVAWMEHRPTGKRSAQQICSQADLRLVHQPGSLWRIVRLYVVNSKWSETIPVFWAK